MSKNSGYNLWKEAKTVIPGGGMLLSKRPENFLPELWPSYYSKCKGCFVWDLDDNKYLDMSIMGIGTNILGYGNEEVDNAVIEAISKGNMSTFYCPEEVYLAKKLIEINPWSDMVRFARTGGEANSIAVRIARAYTGRDKIAVCGYHGWHDWYLAANLKDEGQLENHLLPGLNPEGVPKHLLGTVLTFEYNDFRRLKKLVEENDISIVKMEVMRSIEPKDSFLQKVRKLCDDKGIVLIFDECTSGFRENYGGLHIKYGVNPDIAIFGKALGNGYAVTAVVGRKKIMQSAQSTFISSTFWTERIGSVAGLKTLEVMQKQKAWKKITEKGQFLQSKWKDIFEKFGFDYKILGLPSLSSFVFKDSDFLKYKTFITQELLKKNILSSNIIYLCTEHKKDIIERYINEFELIISKISSIKELNKNIDDYLEVPVCHTGFKRLN